MFRRLLVPIEITRPHNMLVAALSVAAGYYIAGGREMMAIAMPVVLTAFITGAGNVINDYFDVSIDRINKPRRPLPSERLSKRAALYLYIAMSALLLASCALVRPLLLGALMIVWQIALFAYAARLKRVLIAGNVLVAAVSGSAFVAGAIAGGDPSVSGIPALLAFAFVLSREVVKGCEDFDGDSAGHVHTAAVVLGVPNAGRLAAAMMVGFALLIPLPAVAAGYGAPYLWIMLALVVPPLLAGAWMVARYPERRTFTRVSWMLKFGMFFGILAIALR